MGLHRRASIGAVVRRRRPLVVTSFWVLWVSIALWVVGGILVGLGIYGDQHAWWSERPYLTNLVSSVTGAAFGLPIALLILGELAARQRAYSDRYDLAMRLSAGVDELYIKVGQFIPQVTAAAARPASEVDGKVYLAICLAAGSITDHWTAFNSSVIHSLRQQEQLPIDAVGVFQAVDTSMKDLTASLNQFDLEEAERSTNRMLMELEDAKLFILKVKVRGA
jgi:hypothetical protein